jgi:outer membrane protein assembly factor BamD
VPQTALDSFEAFRTVVERFPQSKYAPDARKRMIYLRNRLADYEIRVARHYMDRSAWVAAAQRAHKAIEKYDGAPAVREALRIMFHCYQKLGYTELAQNAEQVFQANFPGESIELGGSGHRWWQFWHAS